MTLVNSFETMPRYFISCVAAAAIKIQILKNVKGISLESPKITERRTIAENNGEHRSPGKIDNAKSPSAWERNS